jgi:hypothetical protein
LIHTKISAYLDSRLEEQITIQAELSHAFQCTLHNINIKWQLLTHLGWFGGIGLGPESVLPLKVSSSILSGANLGGLVNLASSKQKKKWQLVFLFLIISFWTFLRNCIIDKNAKIGRNVIITNADVSAVSKSCFH